MTFTLVKLIKINEENQTITFLRIDPDGLGQRYFQFEKKFSQFCDENYINTLRTGDINSSFEIYHDISCEKKDLDYLKDFVQRSNIIDVIERPKKAK